jgi:Fe-S cluster biogenesis protein NfuA
MKEKVIEVINEIRPAIQLDGGDIEFVEVTDDGIVKVRMVGACSHCPMSQYTLKHNVEARLKKVLPEVKEVIAV